ncbi:MAG: transporter substrate-binding domain-containing protein [Clostridiales bacterium]|nr:transporter substrate-binding domain-containing protein [Clostridiales bacterium]
MKKLICTLLTVVLVLSLTLAFTACKKSNDKLVCGVTVFEPMNYLEGGDWVGFDTEFARAVGQKLGMEVEFVEIQWSQKYFELESGAITCIWNGLTANTTETINDVEKSRSDWYDFSYSYMLNRQCVVVKADRLGEFQTIADLADKKITAEDGSAGHTAANGVLGEGGSFLGAASQVNTFREVMAGASDCAIVDYLLAEQLIGMGDYSGLAIAVIEFDLEPEVYAIGFKKGNTLRDKINAAILELEAEGKLLEIAKKYNIAGSLKIDSSFKN